MANVIKSMQHTEYFEYNLLPSSTSTILILILTGRLQEKQVSKLNVRASVEKWIIEKLYEWIKEIYSKEF